MKKRSIIIYAVVWILFLCCLLTSTKLVCVLNDYIQPREIAFDEIKNGEGNQQVYYGYDVPEVLGTLHEVVHIKGWAFVDAEGENPQRYISIILAGEKDYEFRLDKPQDRKDVKNAFPERKIPDSHVGIGLDCTTLGIENGTYDMYIYCWENEDTHGLVDTGYQLTKRYKEIAIAPWAGSQVKDAPTVTEEEQNKRAVDKTALENGRLNVVGWSFVPNQDTETQTVYLALTSEDGETMTYTTKSKSRPDVAEVYQSELYENSGYTTSIPAEEIADGTYTLQILTENQGKVWASPPADLVKSGDSVAFSYR